MHRLDDLLLDRIYQPICDRSFDTIGDCIVIARRVLMHGVAATVCVFVLWLLDLMVYTRGLPKSVTVFFLLSQVLIGYGLIVIHGRLRQFLGITGANPLRFGLLPARLCSLIWVLLSLILSTVLWLVGVFLFPVFVLATIRDVMGQSAIYFASCHNRPPVRSAHRTTERGYSVR